MALINTTLSNVLGNANKAISNLGQNIGKPFVQGLQGLSSASQTVGNALGGTIAPVAQGLIGMSQPPATQPVQKGLVPNIGPVANPNTYGSMISQNRTPGLISTGTLSSQIMQPQQTNYGQLENRGGTIYNKATGQGYKTPQELATAMGIRPDQIDWTKINQAAPSTPVTTTPTAPAPTPVLPPSTPAPNFTPNPNLPGQLITGLANTAAGVNPMVTGAANSLMGKAEAPTEDYQKAQDLANKINQQIADLRQNYAKQVSNIEGSPIDLSLATGQEGILNRLEAAKEAALSGQFQAATNLLNAANTQQGLEQSAAQAAGGLGQGQQTLAQSGLGQAAALSMPQPYGITTTPYLPATGTFGTMPGGAGGAASAGAIGAQVGQGEAIQNMTGQQSQAQALANNLSGLIDTSNINPSNASVFTSFINGVNQWLNTNSGDPQYQNFANLINEISSRYASILNQSGGTPTDQSTLSHSIINSLASGQDIKTVLSSLDKNATDSINALRSAAQSNAVKTPSTSTTTSGTTGAVNWDNF